MNLNLPEQKQDAIQTSPLREFCKIYGTLLGGKDNAMNSLKWDIIVGVTQRIDLIR
jgi:hypothetical protein